MVTYLVVFVLLLVAELVYFRIADKFNIIDKPNNRSSHTKIVLRGGGIIFAFGAILWMGGVLLNSVSCLPYFSQFAVGPMTSYLPFFVGLMLVAGVSFIDDVHPLPDSLRLVVQFASMFLMFWSLDLLHWNMWWAVILALIVCVGATNVYNFMDGINGITGGYSLAVLFPLLLVQKQGGENTSLLITPILATSLYCLFNF